MVRGIDHIELIVRDVDEFVAFFEKLGEGVKTMREPNYVVATGRTTVNLRDPDGWRMQLVDANRKPPQ